LERKRIQKGIEKRFFPHISDGDCYPADFEQIGIVDFFHKRRKSFPDGLRRVDGNCLQIYQTVGTVISASL